MCIRDRTIPSLTASVNANETIDWYSAAINGTLLWQGSLNYTPTVSGTYYAEARNAITGCKSRHRVEIKLVINTKPELTIKSVECDNDMKTYSTLFETNGIVTSTAGVVNNATKSIINIPKDTNMIITVTENGCISTMEVLSPTCNCAAPAPPVSEGDVIVCNNEKIPLLSVKTFDRNETVDWYSSPNGGSPIFEGNLKFKPNKTGTYYAEARSLLTGCKSGARTPVMLTINQITNAQINLSKSEICLGDSIILSINSNDKLKWSSGENIKTVIKSPLISTEYFVTYEDRNGCADTAFATVKVKETPSIKLLSTTCEISNTSWSLKYATTISDKTEIDSIVGIEDSIYLLSVQGDGCISSIQINKPDCRCSTCDCVSIPAPVKNNGDIFSCQGDPIPPLRVGHQSGVVVDWYDHMNNVLQQGDTVYYPLRDGIYYAQSRSLINPGCINRCV